MMAWVDAVPPEVDAAIEAWKRHEATAEQLQLGAERIPSILADPENGLTDGEWSHLLLTASGMRYEYLKSMGKERLVTEGIDVS